MKKPRIRGGALVAKPYPLLCECIERGIRGGYWKAFGDGPIETRNPDSLPEDLERRLNEYIQLEICEAFDFPEPGEEIE